MVFPMPVRLTRPLFAESCTDKTSRFLSPTILPEKQLRHYSWTLCRTPRLRRRQIPPHHGPSRHKQSHRMAQIRSPPSIPRIIQRARLVLRRIDSCHPPRGSRQEPHHANQREATVYDASFASPGIPLFRLAGPVRWQLYWVHG